MWFILPVVVADGYQNIYFLSPVSNTTTTQYHQEFTIIVNTKSYSSKEEEHKIWKYFRIVRIKFRKINYKSFL